MAAQADPKVVGGFVVGAIALIVLGLLVFGGGQFFTERLRFIAYFPGSVQGLRVGAPVSFRGAQIGQVVDLGVLFDARSGEYRIPVVFEIERGRLRTSGASGDRHLTDLMTQQEQLDGLIEQGLRAQLQTQSLVTGLLLVNLAFFPDSEVRLIGLDTDVPEMPTLASTLEEVQQSIGEVMQDVPTTLATLNAVLADIALGLERNRDQLTGIVGNVAELTGTLNQVAPRLGETVDQANDAVGSVRRAGATAEQILDDQRAPIGALIAEWTETAASVRRMADQINNTIAENREGLQDFTSTGLYEWTGLALDSQEAIAQIRRVADELERNPRRFLFGDGLQGVSPDQ